MSEGCPNKLHLLYDDAKKLGSQYPPLYLSLAHNKKRYAGKSLLGEGSMKMVYKTYDKFTHRYVAMAFPRASNERHRYDEFLREAQLTSLLDHPNIISIHDIHVDHGKKPYFTMELKRGRTLEESLNLEKKQGNKKELKNLMKNLSIFRKICDAMAYAHSLHTLHLDLKPSNIHVGTCGEVLVCDWGLGKITSIDYDEHNPLIQASDLLNNHTLHGAIRGTPGYMAPEQTKVGSIKTEQCDIYALGCILYKMLTYEDPLSGSTENKIQNTQNGKISSPLQRKPQFQIPKSLDAVVQKAMNLKPELRYQSVQHLKNDIVQFCDGYATQAENANFIDDFNYFYKRNKTLSLTCSLSLIAIITGLIFGLNHLHQSEQTAIAERAKAQKALVDYKNEKEKSEFLSSSLDSFITFNKFALHHEDYTHIEKTKKAEHTLKSLLSATPENQAIKDSYALHYFITQQFDRSFSLLSLVAESEHKIQTSKRQNNRVTSEQLRLLARVYQKKLVDNEALLSANDLSFLIKDLIHLDLHTLASYMLIYDSAVREDYTDYHLIINSFFNNNHKVKSFRVHYQHQNNSLKLEGKISNLNKYIKTYFKNLPLHSLDLRNLNSKYMPLFYKQIEKIDIRNSSFEHTLNFEYYSNLKELIISEPNLNHLRKNKLPKHVTLKIEKT